MEWHAVEWRNSERITDTVMFLSAQRLPSPDDIAKKRSARSPERITSAVMISETSARFCVARLISSELSSCILSRTRELASNSLLLDLIRRSAGRDIPGRILYPIRYVVTLQGNLRQLVSPKFTK